MALHIWLSDQSAHLHKEITRIKAAGLYGSLIFNFFEGPPYYFCSRCTNSQPCQKCTRFPFSPDSRWCFLSWQVWNNVFYGFNLHFPDDYWCWTYFHVPVGHLYVFFGKMSIQVFSSYFNGSACFLMLSCLSYLYVLDINSLCDIVCLVAQQCPSLCDPMDCSPPGSSVHGDSPGKNSGMGCMPSSRLWDILFANIFSYLVHGIYVLWIVSFAL